MTALLLKRLAALGLAEIGVEMPALTEGRARSTTWLQEGVGLRVYASGRAVYVVQARMNGRPRTITLAASSVISEAQAVQVARRVLAQALLGDNPAAVRERVRAAPAWPVFIAEYWRLTKPRWKLSTLKAHNVYRRLYLDSAFADHTVDAIDGPEVVRWFARLSDRCGPGGANRCLEILNAMMGKAESWGYRVEGSNPCAGMRRNRRRKFERFLSEAELARIGTRLDAEREHSNAYRRAAASAVLLLILTGCRLGEVLGLRWSDLRGLRLGLGDSKTGPRTVWLSEEARAIIDRLPRHKTALHLFVAHSKVISASYLQAFWKEVRHEGGISSVRLHDLRHTFASHAAQRAETLPMIARMLGHANVQSTARYAHLDDAGAQAAAELIGRRVEHLLDEHAPRSHS